MNIRVRTIYTSKDKLFTKIKTIYPYGNRILWIEQKKNTIEIITDNLDNIEEIDNRLYIKCDPQ